MMKRLLLVTLASYVFLGNVALAGVAFAAPTLLPSEDTSLMTPLPSLACENGTKNIATPGSAGCPVDRCIVESGDQTENEAVALLPGGQEYTSPVAITVEEAAAENLGVAYNHRGKHEGKNLVAAITSSVFLKE